MIKRTLILTPMHTKPKMAAPATGGGVLVLARAAIWPCGLLVAQDGFHGVQQRINDNGF